MISLGQFDGKSTAITGKDLEILLYINNGLNGPRGISNKSNISKSTVHRVLKKLELLNLLFSKKGKYYLTVYGKICCFNITRASPTKELIFRLHKYSVSIFIESYPTTFFNKKKVIVNKYYLSQTVYRNIKDSVTVSIHPSKICFVLPSISALSLRSAELNAHKIINFLIEQVKTDYPGIKFGKNVITSHIDDNHIAIINHHFSIPFTKFMQLFGQKYCYKGTNVEFDFSTGEAELEFVHKLYAKNHCYKLARFTNWIVEEDNFEKLMKLVNKYGSEL